MKLKLHIDPEKDEEIIIYAHKKSPLTDAIEQLVAENGVEIIGSGRTGALYGAYEILKEQGIRWVSPYIAPKRVKNGAFTLPTERKEYVPSMPLGRGFLFAGESMDATALIGCGIMMAGIIVAQIPSRGR